MGEKDLFSLLSAPGTDDPPFEPHYLRDYTRRTLRDRIVDGSIPPGTKLVEREVARALSVSRAPARDALRELEREGLVVARSTGRYVIQLTERDIRSIYQIRRPLEIVAVELAIQKASPESLEVLRNAQLELENTLATRDLTAHINGDLEMHRTIWRASGNQYLLDVLNSMIGPILMLFANNASIYSWDATLQSHRELVRYLLSRDLPHATDSIERHIDDSLSRSLGAFGDHRAARESSD